MSLTKLFLDGIMFPLLSLKFSLSQAGILTESFWISYSFCSQTGVFPDIPLLQTGILPRSLITHLCTCSQPEIFPFWAVFPYLHKLCMDKLYSYLINHHRAITKTSVCLLVQYMCTLSTMKTWWEERLAIYRPSNISHTALDLTIAKLKKLFLI